jgi:hypothetical protein
MSDMHLQSSIISDSAQNATIDSGSHTARFSNSLASTRFLRLRSSSSRFRRSSSSSVCAFNFSCSFCSTSFLFTAFVRARTLLVSFWNFPIVPSNAPNSRLPRRFSSSAPVIRRRLSAVVASEPLSMLSRGRFAVSGEECEGRRFVGSSSCPGTTTADATALSARGKCQWTSVSAGIEGEGRTLAPRLPLYSATCKLWGCGVVGLRRRDVGKMREACRDN